ncbi:tape-measure protein [Streptomyces sp. NBC_01275]|uniref:tape-measure protein n=1 Tax=Streptomyces sp. NBC_01275 TaxID=2903807 RepID=UPI0022563969|nr:tape-measure protein [Streptomyces sp. NBC_01275]MCX4764319.1 tape-measure protein [Streptomyces sp. NBC_01275]
MSTAGRTAGGWTADPLVGVAPSLRDFRTRLQQTGGALVTLGGRIAGAAGAADRIRSAADQGGTAVRGAKANAEAAARSVTRAGETATASAAGVKSAGSGAKGSGTSLGRLLSGLGGVVALVAGLLGIAGPLGDLMGAVGTAMTIGAGVMLIVNALTRANPIGFVTGLLLPVAGWLLDLAMNSETGQRLMEQLATLVLKYVEGYLTVMTPLLKAIAGAVNTYVTAYLAVVTTALTAVGALVGTGFALLKALTTGDTRALSGRVSSLWRGFKDAVKPALAWIGKDVPGMFTRIKEATARTLNALGQFVTTGAQTVAGVVKGPIQGLVAFANWVIDGLNSLSFSILGKKFGVHLDRIPMLAEGGIAVPGASRRAGRVLPLTALDRQRALAARHRTASQLPYHVKEFHESHGVGAHGVATDLLFLASAHACP